MFGLSDSELGCIHLVKNFIDTSAHCPFKQHPYKTPAVHREKIDPMLTDMEKQEVIKPSTSPRASSVVLVPKKDIEILCGLPSH